jgi:DNA invertase Pin-like site-specific DNA recombinase
MDIETVLPKQKRAYSYVRFSRAHQEEGDSLRRQTLATAKYCEVQGFILDHSLNLQDKGVSAFTGRNAKHGALGRFLDACESGIVPKGSALIVENLDRLSRQTPRKTQALISQLLDDYKIEIHLTMVGKTLLPQRDDGMEAMYVVALATSANEESARKSRRLKEVFAEKRRQAAAGQGTLVHPVIPWWLERDTSTQTFIVPPERAAAIELAYELAAKGWSTAQIARHLHQAGTPTWRTETRKTDRNGKPNANYGKPLKWDSSYLIKLLKTDAVQGSFSPQGRRGRTHTILNYYPRVISDELAAEARAAQGRLARGARGRTADPSAPRPVNLFRNLLRFRGRWVRFGCAPNRRGDTYYGFYECIESKVENEKSKLIYYSSGKQLEPVLLAALTELNPDDLRPLPEEMKPMRSSTLNGEIARLEAKSANLLAAIESGSVAVASRLKQLEGDLAVLRQQLAQALLEETIPADTANGVELQQLRSSQYNLSDNVTRERIAASLRRIIARIDIGREVKDLSLTKSQLHRYMGEVINGRQPLIVDNTPTDRGRPPIYLAITFVGGGHRLIVRDESLRGARNRIISIRISPNG